MKNSQNDISFVEYVVSGLVVLFFGSLYFWLNSSTPDVVNNRLASHKAMPIDRSTIQAFKSPANHLNEEANITEKSIKSVQKKAEQPIDIALNKEKNNTIVGIKKISPNLAELAQLKTNSSRQTDEINQLRIKLASQQSEIIQLKNNVNQPLISLEDEEKAAHLKTEIEALNSEINLLEKNANKKSKQPEAIKKETAPLNVKEPSTAKEPVKSQKNQPNNSAIHVLEKAIIESDLKNPIIFNAITFDSGSAKLSPQSSVSVNEIVEILQQYTDVSILIRGHTDNVGSIKSNTLLSLTRSESLKQTLVKKGVDKTRLMVEGVGSMNPIASNKTNEGRKKNRRIELIITE